MNCIKCHRENRDGAKFCLFCGEKLETNDFIQQRISIPAQPDAYDAALTDYNNTQHREESHPSTNRSNTANLSIDSSNSVCPSCGSVLRSGSKFCLKCGHKIDVVDSDTTLDNSQSFDVKIPSDVFSAANSTELNIQDAFPAVSPRQQASFVSGNASMGSSESVRTSPAETVRKTPPVQAQSKETSPKSEIKNKAKASSPKGSNSKRDKTIVGIAIAVIFVSIIALVLIITDAFKPNPPVESDPIINTEQYPASDSNEQPYVDEYNDYNDAPENTEEVPYELRQYQQGLKKENRNYRIDLQEDDWNINYRSSPQVIRQGEPGFNIIGVLRSGTVIYVEYIYNDTWAVFQLDNRYVFASLYASNDSSQRLLMKPTTADPSDTMGLSTERVTETTSNKQQSISQIVGTYKGQYVAGQGLTGLTLSIYKTSDVLQNRSVLQEYADVATYYSQNSEGIPQKEYTEEDIENIVRQHAGEYIAFFSFYPLASNPDVEDGLYTMSVNYDSAAERYSLAGESWIQRDSYTFVNLNDVYVENGEMFGSYDLHMIKQ